MRIAQIAPLMESVPPKLYGGTERIVSYLTEELVKLGHDVTLARRYWHEKVGCMFEGERRVGYECNDEKYDMSTSALAYSLWSPVSSLF